MARLRVEEFQAARHAPRTIEAYTADWLDFERWCGRSGYLSMPAAPDTVALYLSILAPTRKVSTLARRVAAIAWKHSMAGIPSPTTPLVRAVISGARRKSTAGIHRKAAMSPGELLLISTYLSGVASTRSLRDRAAILLGYSAALRRSDVVALDLSDIDLRADRVSLALRRSKTDQEARGRELIIPRAKNSALCIVRALAAWLGLRGDWPGPLFCDVSIGKDSIIQDRMSDHIIYYSIKFAAQKCGLDPKRFGAHSLRAGAATAAADAGADVFEIMALTGHRSADVAARYVRRAVVNYPLRKVL